MQKVTLGKHKVDWIVNCIPICWVCSKARFNLNKDSKDLLKHLNNGFEIFMLYTELNAQNWKILNHVNFKPLRALHIGAVFDLWPVFLSILLKLIWPYCVQKLFFLIIVHIISYAKAWTTDAWLNSYLILCGPNSNPNPK